VTAGSGSGADLAAGAGHVDVGVDVGATTTRVLAFADGDVPSAVRRSGTPRAADELLDLLTREIPAVVGSERVGTVGIGMPGRVDTATGAVSMALNLGIERPLAVGAELGRRLGVPVVLENDVNAAALGAFETMDGGLPRSLVYLSIGTGFAAGAVLDGRLLRGGRGGAGELGHVPAPGSDLRCACGQRGCIEARVSGGAIATRLHGLGIGVGATALWDAADGGHLAARAIRDDVVATIAWAAQLAVMMLDVDVVMLGGGVTALGDRLIDHVRARLRHMEHDSRLLSGIEVSHRLARAPDGVELGALGALLSARQRLVPRSLGEGG
jgi:glucokinase